MSEHTFLITGANSGIGLALVRAALAAGHIVIATCRDISSARATIPDLFPQCKLWLELDITSPNIISLISDTVREHDVDILVNNAGYGLRGVLEDLTISQIHAQMSTNFLGAMAVTQGAIPHFRAQGRGTIVMISSASALTGTPSQSAYSASKFALEGASESLAAELAPFGVRVLLAVLGAFRTPFQTAVETPAELMSEPYKGTVADLAAKRITAGHGRQDGDPEKAAKIIVEVATATGKGKELRDVFRLLLGRDAVVRAQSKIESLSRDLEATREIAKTCSFGERWDGYPPL